jgi:hypothetical protein
LAAGLRRIRVGGIFDHILVGSLPVRITRVAAVALFTAHEAVILIFSELTVNINLLVRSQRLHLSPSTLTLNGR